MSNFKKAVGPKASFVDILLSNGFGICGLPAFRIFATTFFGNIGAIPDTTTIWEQFENGLWIVAQVLSDFSCERAFPSDNCDPSFGFRMSHVWNAEHLLTCLRRYKHLYAGESLEFIQCLIEFVKAFTTNKGLGDQVVSELLVTIVSVGETAGSFSFL